MNLARRLATVPVLLAVLGCADLRDVISLQRQLSREFAGGAISVHLNNHVHLTVTLSQSPAGSSEAATARRVAEYIRDHYPRYATLRTIHIAFGDPEAPDTRYRFDPHDLGAPPSPPVKERTPVKVA